ncbi:MAG TPA: type II secretion system protein, partial [Verrucomicrobiae bacterium]|nr:type II secretion system protein [Verrucomicrobiae bacterium]
MVMAIIGMLAAMLMPALAHSKARAQCIQCVNNLREQGLAFQMFAHDHGSQVPASVSADSGGAADAAQTAAHLAGEFYFSYRLFQPLSNDLVNAKLLWCPADTRLAADNFAELRNTNLSYFMALNADPSRPTSIVTGD